MKRFRESMKAIALVLGLMLIMGMLAACSSGSSSSGYSSSGGSASSGDATVDALRNFIDSHPNGYDEHELKGYQYAFSGICSKRGF